MRNQRAAQLRDGSITEMILCQNQNKKNIEKFKSKGFDEKELTETETNHEPVKIGRSAVSNTLVIVFHLKEWAVLTA
jgi:hypothetical protein